MCSSSPLGVALLLGLLIGLERPYLLHAIKWAYLAMLFSTPYIGFSLMFSLAYIFLGRQGTDASSAV